jgi:hypothetical protein
VALRRSWGFSRGEDVPLPRLLADAEFRFQTDYALAGARQDLAGDADTQTYAASGSGAVGLICGSKFSDVLLRLERWDERPPSVDDDWEDRDLLPWRSIEDGGPLVGHGFEGVDDDAALDLGGLGLGRVEVLAAGRHRYDYSDFPGDEMPPERWLLRLWPTDAAVDPLTGPPRRVAGPLPFFYPDLTAFGGAVHGWSTTGWSDALNIVTAAYEIKIALLRIGRPAETSELAELFGPWGGLRDRDGAYTWESPVTGRPAGIGTPSLMAQETGILEPLAAAAGMASIDTFADMAAAMRALGLLTEWQTSGKTLLVPNAAPPPIWEALPNATDELVHFWKLRALAADFGSLEGDIQHLLRWTPERTLTATLTRIAVRLGVSVGHVSGVLQLSEMRGQITVTPSPDPEESAAPITLAATSGFLG